MKFIVLLILLLRQTGNFAQLNCRNGHSGNKQTKTCFHRNGKVSTIEEWDKDNKTGNIKAFDVNGAELFVYYLRNFAGHASVELSYHKNGQVSRVHYSSAPDGGIQYFRARRSYDEKGALIEHWEDEYPSKPLTEPIYHLPYPQKIKPAEPVTNTCAVPYTSLFMVSNVSGKTIELELEPKPNLWVSKTKKVFKLKPGQRTVLDSILFAEKFFAPDAIYKLSILSPKKIKGLNIVHAVPYLQDQKQVYMLYIIRE